MSFSSSHRDETVGEARAWRRGLGVVCLASHSCDGHKKSRECPEGKAKCVDVGLLAVKTRWAHLELELVLAQDAGAVSRSPPEMGRRRYMKVLWTDGQMDRQKAQSPAPFSVFS